MRMVTLTESQGHKYAFVRNIKQFLKYYSSYRNETLGNRKEQWGLASSDPLVCGTWPKKGEGRPPSPQGGDASCRRCKPRQGGVSSTECNVPKPQRRGHRDTFSGNMTWLHVGLPCVTSLSLTKYGGDGRTHSYWENSRTGALQQFRFQFYSSYYCIIIISSRQSHKKTGIKVSV